MGNSSIKIIDLTQDRFALVDDEDFDRVSKYKWFAHKEGKLRTRWYAMRSSKSSDGSSISIKMHRFILDAPPGMDVDHINGDCLDNRRSNLRLASRSQNVRNGRSHKDSTSRYKGVGWNSQKQKWQAQIRVNKSNIYLGFFTDETVAARTYDKSAKEYFGDYAKLNFDEGGE